MVEGHRIAYLVDRGFQETAPEAVVSCLAQLGYDGVEWGLAHFNVQTKSDAYLDNLVRLTSGAGLEISEVEQAAGNLIASGPVLLVFLLFQRYFIKGLTSGYGK
jgi:ABC-type maltose transport system permease subunit